MWCKDTQHIIRFTFKESHLVQYTAEHMQRDIVKDGKDKQKSESLTGKHRGRWQMARLFQFQSFMEQSKVTCVYSEWAGDYTRIVGLKLDYTPPAVFQAWISRMNHHAKITPGNTSPFQPERKEDRGLMWESETSSPKLLIPHTTFFQYLTWLCVIANIFES